VCVRAYFKYLSEEVGAQCIQMLSTTQEGPYKEGRQLHDKNIHVFLFFSFDSYSPSELQGSSRLIEMNDYPLSQ
jgi:hypothetical protein